jgi:hypothetical protein
MARNTVKVALQWAFGKDGVNLTVYIILYLLIDFWDTLLGYGVPEAVLFATVSIVVNLNNNTIKDLVAKVQVKYDEAKKLVYLMKQGYNYDAAKDALREDELSAVTVIERHQLIPPPSPFETPEKK